MTQTKSSRPSSSQPPSSAEGGVVFSDLVSNWRDVILTRPTAAMIAGTLEVIVFHPIDTMSKRLMSHERRVVGTDGLGATFSRVKQVITTSSTLSSPTSSISSTTSSTELIKDMYSGTKYAAYYKISQRIVRFAGQPLVNEFLLENPSTRRACTNLTGGSERRGKQLMEAAAGSFVGVLELSLLPFDRMKVLSQTNTQALQGRSLWRIMLVDEGPRAMYAGIGPAAQRNALGSFILFGGTAFIKDNVFRLEDYKTATFTQNLVSSTFGASLAVFATNPMDVIKTRIQNKNFSGRQSAGGTSSRSSGWQVFKTTVKNEGVSAFFKGVTPKVVVSSPKLVFTYTVTQHLTGYFQQMRRK